MPLDGLTLLAALTSGLLGGVHCAAMCGGIATGFSSLSTRSGWWPALQVNLGRVGGYVVAGALVGGIGGGLLRVFRIESVALGLRMAVGAVLVLIAVRLLDRRGRFRIFAGPATRFWNLLRPLQSRMLPADTALRRFGMGMLWGWLPCGVSLTVLTAAWLQANARDAALTMLAFGLGTLPMMVPITWSGARLGRWLQRPAWRMAAACVVLAAGVLTLSAPWLMRVPHAHAVLSALGCRTLPA